MQARIDRRRPMLGLAVLAVSCAALPAWAASGADPAAAAGDTQPVAAGDKLFGDYLAGHHAQQERDFPAAAGWFDKAIVADPDAPELVTRTFLMSVGAGNFAHARHLAPAVLKIDPTDALAQLVMTVEALKAHDAQTAIGHAAALPRDGIHRFIGPLALAWSRMAGGDLAGADTAMQGLDKFNGFAPLKAFQLGLIYDFAGQADKAEAFYDKTLADTTQLNWRLTEAVGNFYERHGKEAKAKALYKKFIDDNVGSEIAQSVLASRAPGVPKPMIANAGDGLAEAMFDLASVLNQSQTVDLSLVYVRFSLELQPDFGLAQLLLADVLSTQEEPAQSLAVVARIPKQSPYSWSARLREAIDLDALDRSDEAIALLKSMAKDSPLAVSADVQLGDLLRNKKQFAAAVDAYDEALQRAARQGLPERWTLFYDRGVALERSGQWQRAEPDLRHALELQPEQPLVLNYLGYSWIDRGEQLDKAMKMIEKAVELRPEDGYIVDSLGWAHYRIGDYAGAVQYLERAVELVPSDPTINDHLGDAYWQSGRLTEARYQWRRALQFGPEKEEIKPIEAKLEKGLAPPTPSERGG